MRTPSRVAERALLTGLVLAVVSALLAGCGAIGGAGPTPGPSATPATTTQATGPAFPLKVSSDGRYLVDQRDTPFFYAADTAWTMLSRLSVADAKKLIDLRASQGFTAIQSVLTSFTAADGGPHGVPFADGDLTRPVESYWQGVDEILRYANRRGILVYAVPLWMANNGGWACESGGCQGPPSVEVMRTYMTWVGERYRDQPNLVWVAGGDDEIDRNREVKQAGARALHQADPGHLMTYHPRWLEYGFADEAWYSIYAFQKNDITAPYDYEQIREAYDRTPTRPVLDAEPPYEPQTAMQDGDVVTAAINRRFGWWAALSGAMGVSYGGPPGTWNIGEKGEPDWSAVDRDPARQTGAIRRILAPLAWYHLRPDWDAEVVTGGRGEYGGQDYATAAATEDGTLVVAFAPSAREFTLDASRLSGPATLTWYDPVSGVVSGEPRTVEPKGTLAVATPGANSGGDGDWVLVIRASS
jgi:hypothetical protein